MIDYTAEYLKDYVYRGPGAEPGTWVVAEDGRSATVTDRVKLPFLRKINPIWWFKNDFEPDPPEYYMPESKQFWRVFFWYCRNPLQNFQAYVFGVKDRNYTVYGKAPVMVILMSDIGQTGWLWKVIHVGWRRLPYIGYSGTKIEFHIGWTPYGDFRMRVTGR